MCIYLAINKNMCIYLARMKHVYVPGYNVNTCMFLKINNYVNVDGVFCKHVCINTIVLYAAL